MSFKISDEDRKMLAEVATSLEPLATRVNEQFSSRALEELSKGQGKSEGDNEILATGTALGLIECARAVCEILAEGKTPSPQKMLMIAASVNPKVFEVVTGLSSRTEQPQPAA